MHKSESLADTYYAKPPGKRIICDKLRMRVGLNLYEALRRLSGEDCPLMEQKYIWVDALCINQNDPDERSAQVLLMGEIYKSASSVIVWLGECLLERALALRVIEELERIPFNKHAEMERMPITDDNSYYSLGIRKISDREWGVLLGFFRREWFSRVWVVQEAVFAGCILFLCGNRTIDPDTLFAVGKLLILSGWTSQIWAPYLPMLMAAPGPPPGGIAVISQMMEDLAKVEKPPPLNILASVRARNATDPRDKVYALLNVIAVALSTTPSELSVQPNYKDVCDLSSVLEAATLMCIRADKTLGFLPLVQERKIRKASGCASWTVDWSSAMEPSPLAMMQIINNIWNTSSGMQLECPDSTIPGVLRFRAARVCSIVQLSLDGRDMGSDLSGWMDCALGLHQPYPYGLKQGVTEILWTTLIADNALQQHPAPAEFGLGFMYNYICTSLGITSPEVGIGFVFKYTFISVYRKLGLDAAEVAREEGKLVREVDALRAADPDSIFPPPQKIRELFHIIRDMDDSGRVLLE